MTRRNDDRRFHFAFAHAQFNNVVFFQAEFRQRRAGNDCRIVPAQAGHRLGQLLQPADIVPATVINIWIGPEDDFERIFRRWRGNCAFKRGSGIGFRGPARDRVRNPSIVQRLAPAGFKIALDRRLPCFAHRVVWTHHRIVEQRLEDVMRRASAIQRIDHRLHDGNRAVVSARVGPGFEIVRGGNVPMRLLPRFVVVRTKVGYDVGLVEGVGRN